MQKLKVIAAHPGMCKTLAVSNNKKTGVRELSHTSFYVNGTFSSSLYAMEVYNQAKRDGILLITTHREVLTMLETLGVDVILLYPSIFSKKSWMDIMKKRQINPMLLAEYDQWYDYSIKDLDKKKFPKVVQVNPFEGIDLMFVLNNLNQIWRTPVDDRQALIDILCKEEREF